MIQRKVSGCSDGFILRVGNIEIAYNFYGSTTQFVCRPPIDFSSKLPASQWVVGAFKVDGKDWVVCQSGNTYRGFPHSFLISKFCKPSDRLPQNIFTRLFMSAYTEALIEESRIIQDKLDKGELNL